ncbi:MAG: PilC/PilY family type IV pilus protein [Marinagarivorans sp.]|nr:PilC/PilY family type IV pilus protein [Marinagarivorans sp.]
MPISTKNSRTQTMDNSHHTNGLWGKMMKIPNRSNHTLGIKSPAVLAMLSCLAVPYCLWASSAVHAAEKVALAESPIESLPAAEPNVLLVMDDSGSMDWEIIAEGQPESLEIYAQSNPNTRRPRLNTTFAYAYLYANANSTLFGNHHGYDSYDGYAVPTVAAVQAFIDKTGTQYQTDHDKLKSLWRMRNHQYNSLYYNPSTTYKPWLGYTNSLPTCSWVSPKLTQCQNTPTGAINLTRPQDIVFFFQNLNHNNANARFHEKRVDVNGSSTGNATTASYIPMYYQADNTYPLLCGRLFEITTSGIVEKSCDGRTTHSTNATINRAATRTDCSNGVCSAAQELQNFANWFSYYRRREFSAKFAYATAVNNLSDVRLGYTTINAKRRNDAGYTDSVSTQIAPYTQVKEKIISNIYSTKAGGGGTRLLNSLDEAGKYYQCDQADIFGTKGTSTCPRRGERQECQTNYTLLMTDGFWEVDKGKEPVSASYNQDTQGDYAGDVFAFNNQQQVTLADVAMHYYKNDLDESLADKVEMTAQDKAYDNSTTAGTAGKTMHQHMKTYTFGFGVSTDETLPLLNATPPWTPFDIDSRSAQEKVDDLKHAALNGRGKFYSASNAQSLADKLAAAFKDLPKGKGGVGAVSFNGDKLESGSLVYSTSYNMTTDSGDIVAYGTRTNANGDLSFNLTTPLWSASTKLNAQIEAADTASCSQVSNRNIISFSNNAGVTLSDSASTLSPNQKDWLLGKNIVEGTGADCGANLRTRTAGLIGDIVNSRAIFIGSPSFENRSGSAYPSTKTYAEFVKDNQARTPLLATGTNGGMLQIFNATTGKELMGYVPGHLLEGSTEHNGLAQLTSENYKHKYYADLTPAINDVFISNRNGAFDWHTVAIGGYRSGGKGYFALDLSQAITNENTAKATAMWEFTTKDLAANDQNELGLSFNTPTLAMVNESIDASDATKGKKWKAIFGNGYNSPKGDASLFLLNVDNGYDGWSTAEYTIIRTNSAPAASTTDTLNGLSTPRAIDTNSDGAVDYVYAGDLKGNLWRFDLTATPYSATKIFAAVDRNGKVQPITTQPLVVKEAGADKYRVIITTGSWLNIDDVNNTDLQSIYGIVDAPKDVAFRAPARSVLARRSIQDNTTTKIRSVIEHEGTTTDVNIGWVIDLVDITTTPSTPTYTGERAIRNMVLRAGFASVNSIFSSGTSCTPQFKGATMSFEPLTGLVSSPFMDINNDGVINAGDKALGFISDGILSDTSLFDGQIFIKLTDNDGSSVIDPRKITKNDKNTGRLSWRQID